MRNSAPTKTGNASEFARIAWLTQLFGKQRMPSSIKLGIGDDAAVIRSGRKHWVWTVDACVEGVHFRHDWLSPHDLGWRSFHAAVSDLAAMGAQPVAALSSVALPKHSGLAMFRSIARGQAAAARSLSCPIIGGNLTSASECSVHTTVLGITNRPLKRSGARAGDQIWLIGIVGAAAAGLQVLRRVPVSKRTVEQRWCIRIWRRPTALITDGYALRRVAHAAIDVSDGLVADLHHITEACGVRAVLDAASLRTALSPQLLRAAHQLKCDALDWALFGGEDYALIAIGPGRQKPANAAAIGQVERGHGVWLRHAERVRPLLAKGFDHFG